MGKGSFVGGRSPETVFAQTDPSYHWLLQFIPFSWVQPTHDPSNFSLSHLWMSRWRGDARSGHFEKARIVEVDKFFWSRCSQDLPTLDVLHQVPSDLSDPYFSCLCGPDVRSLCEPWRRCEILPVSTVSVQEMLRSMSSSNIISIQIAVWGIWMPGTDLFEILHILPPGNCNMLFQVGIVIVWYCLIESNFQYM